MRHLALAYVLFYTAPLPVMAGQFEMLYREAPPPVGSEKEFSSVAVDADGSVFFTQPFVRTDEGLGRMNRWSPAHPGRITDLTVLPDDALLNDPDWPYGNTFLTGRMVVGKSGALYTLGLEEGVIYKATHHSETKPLKWIAQTYSGNPCMTVLIDGTDTLMGVSDKTVMDAATGEPVTRAHLWKCSPAGQLTTVATLSPMIHGHGNNLALARAADGTVYGATSSGGAADHGAIWSWHPSRGLKLMHAIPASQQASFAAVVPLTGGNILCFEHMFSKVWIKRGSLPLELLAELPEALGGWQSQNTIAVGKDGKVYGLSVYGGSDGRGTLWAFEPLATQPSFELLHDFGPDDPVPSDYSQMVLAPDGNLVGTANGGLWRYEFAAPESRVSTVAMPLTGQGLNVATLAGAVLSPTGNLSLSFEVGTSPQSLTTIVPATAPTTPLVAGMPTAFSAPVRNLKSNTRYYYRTKVQGSGGVWRSRMLSFKTSQLSALVETHQIDPPSHLLPTLAGHIIPQGTGLIMPYFRLGTSPSLLDQIIPTNPPSVMGQPNATGKVTLLGSSGPLLPHTTYYCELVAENEVFTAMGGMISFRTPNRTPAAGDDSFELLPGTTVMLPVLTNDADMDGDSLTISHLSGPAAAAGKAKRAGTGISVTTTSRFSGGDLYYEISDGFGGVAGAYVTLTRGTASLSPTVQQLPAFGGTHQVQIDTVLTWSAVENVSWVKLSTAGGVGQGSVLVTVMPNPGKAARECVVTIGGEEHRIQQAGVLAPSFGALDPVPQGRVSSWFQFPLPIVNPPVAYQVTGLPSGLSINAAANRIEGIPNVGSSTPFAISIIGSNAAGSTRSTPLQFNLYIQPLNPNLIGSWGAHLARSSANNQVGGRLLIKATPTGGVTGTVEFGLDKRSFTGRLNTSPEDGSLAMLQIQVSKSRAPTIALHARIGPSGDANQLVGTITSSSDALPAGFAGSRFAFPAEVAPYVADGYNAFVSPGGMTTPPTPKGHGIARLFVSASGATQWTGRLADGTVLASSWHLEWSGGAGIFQPIGNAHGSVIGHSSITLATAPAAHALSGQIDWLKHTNTTRSFPDGFHLTNLTFLGHQYERPVPPALALGVQPTSGIAPNATVRLLAQGIPLSWSVQGCRIASTGVPYISASTSVNPGKIRFLGFKPSTGEFNGSFVETDAHGTRSGTFHGLLDPESGFGKGFHIIGRSPSAAGETILTTPLQSDTLELLPGF